MRCAVLSGIGFGTLCATMQIVELGLETFGIAFHAMHVLYISVAALSVLSILQTLLGSPPSVVLRPLLHAGFAPHTEPNSSSKQQVRHFYCQKVTPLLHASAEFLLMS